MEPEAVKRRGRKRKRRNGEDRGKVGKKTVVGTGGIGMGTGTGTGTGTLVLIGRYVKKEFDGSGEFLGKIVSYDTGLYMVEYEDGDCEDLETHEVKGLLVKDSEMDATFQKRKKSLD